MQLFQGLRNGQPWPDGQCDPADVTGTIMTSLTVLSTAQRSVAGGVADVTASRDRARSPVKLVIVGINGAMG